MTDLDQDGRPDLVAPSPGGRVQAVRNVTTRAAADQTKLAWEAFPTNAEDWRSAIAADLDLDGSPDLLGLPAVTAAPGKTPVPAWARNEGKRLSAGELPVGLETPGLEGLALADLVGDPLPDLLIVRPGQPPAVARNLGNGHHWLALQLGGHWRVKPELMRTNSHALGTRVIVEGQGVHVSYDHTTPDSGLAQSIGPVVLGLGKREAADLVHLRWPDGVMQCELNVPANQQLVLSENNRKTGSCPVLFTWNGERFVCLGDFLGGGGLGYLVAPGVYSQPDRDEAVAIAPDQLRAEQGVFRLSVTEPMDEVAYLDHLKLEVVDRPPGVSATPDERFAPSGPRPTGQLLAWRDAIEPVRATDLDGRDMTETLRRWDRHTVDTFRKLDGWVGYAEEHGIVLDFGDRLARFGPSDPLVLCLAGWVEYPYSQTNYAAATAGVTLQPPAIERKRDDGTWELIEPHAGYPAGLPRLTTLDLTGKLTGKSCVLRIKTNMECYYDQAFIAVRDRKAESSLRVTTVAGRAGGPRSTRLHPRDLARRPPAAHLRLRPRRPGPARADVGQADAVRRRGLAAPGRRRPVLRGRTRRRGPARIRRREPARLAPGLDAQLRPAVVRLLQGRRPVHRGERHRRALALARHARVPVRLRSRPADDPGPRGLSARVSDSAGGWGRGQKTRSMTFRREEGRSGSRAAQPSSAFRLYSVALISLAAHST